jgi:hypothetical protein
MGMELSQKGSGIGLKFDPYTVRGSNIAIPPLEIVS